MHHGKAYYELDPLQLLASPVSKMKRKDVHHPGSGTGRIPPPPKPHPRSENRVHRLVSYEWTMGQATSGVYFETVTAPCWSVLSYRMPHQAQRPYDAEWPSHASLRSDNYNP